MIALVFALLLSVPLYAAEPIWVEVKSDGPEYGSFVQFTEQGMLVEQPGYAWYFDRIKKKQSGRQVEVYWKGRFVITFVRKNNTIKILRSASFGELRIETEHSTPI